MPSPRPHAAQVASAGDNTARAGGCVGPPLFWSRFCWPHAVGLLQVVWAAQSLQPGQAGGGCRDPCVHPAVHSACRAQTSLSPQALYCWAGDAGGLQAPCTTHPCRRPALHPPACQHITPKQAPSPCSHSHGCVPQPSLPCKPPARESLRVWESPKPSVGSMGAQE